MKQLVNIVNNADMLKPFSDEKAFIRYVKNDCGCHGAELIACPPMADDKIKSCAVGYHLIFYPNWLDFYFGNEKYLKAHFGTKEVWQEYYMAKNGDDFLQSLRRDMDAAESLGVEYAVFHCADVSNEEVLLNTLEHTNTDVIDATASLINAATKGKNYGFKLLFENLFVPGMTLVEPKETDRLLSRIDYANCGIMLDTGHLMAASKLYEDDFFDEQSGAEALCHIIARHGQLKKHIHGVHLHSCNLLGTAHAYKQPILVADDFYTRCDQSYDRILKLDAHAPLKTDALKRALDMLDLSYIVHELRADSYQEKAAAVKAQQKAMGLIYNA